MRVLLASKALVRAAYQRKLEEIAAHPSVSHLTAVVPPAWREPGNNLLRLEKAKQRGYDLRVADVMFNGNFHLFYWPTLGRIIRETRPDVIHIDEEPYNLATVLATAAARLAGIPSLFFTWQNLNRSYPPPFSLFEKFVFDRSAYALVGNREAETVIRAKGYRGPFAYIPQFGVDVELFTPRPAHSQGTFRIGYVARLVEEKGLQVLLDAVAGLTGDWRLSVIGSGPYAEQARARAQRLGIQARIDWESNVPSTLIPERVREFDTVVLPSLTRKHWKEQFGRTLIEAMACEVPVVGSSSGEIPNVIGEGGVITPEGDALALSGALGTLRSDPALRSRLGTAGRARVARLYTHQKIARDTVAVYESMIGRR